MREVTSLTVREPCEIGKLVLGSERPRLKSQFCCVTRPSVA